VVQALLNQARAAQGAGNWVRARALLTQALSGEPNNPEALHALAIVTATLGDNNEAVRMHRRAVAARPRHAPWHRDLARTLTTVARFDLALGAVERSLQLDPNDAEAHALHGAILNRLRRPEEAAGAVRRSLDLEPGRADATLLLARIHIAAGEDDRAEALLTTMVDAPGQHPPHLYSALHLLGEILERRAEYDRAFEAHDRANRAVTGLALTKALASAGRIDRVPDYLAEGAADHYRRWGEGAPNDGLPTPTFLVGFVRSGTTMTEQILRAHPRVKSLDERNLTEALYHRVRAMCDADAYDHERFLERLDTLSGAQLTELRRAYWDLVRGELGPDGASWVVVDKNPLEILDVGLIARVFPRAPIIVVLRDPRDCCLSALFQPFALNPSTVRMLDVETVGAYYATVMRFWLDIRGMLPNPTLEIHYEDIVSNFDTHARRLIEFAGLEWSDEVTRFHEKAAKRPVFSASYLSVTKKINTRAVGRWANYEAHLAPLIDHVRPFLDAFGYEE
jgi:tetratricopeptide (TPR) repeat protein